MGKRGPALRGEEKWGTDSSFSSIDICITCICIYIFIEIVDTCIYAPESWARMCSDL